MTQLNIKYRVRKDVTEIIDDQEVTKSKIIIQDVDIDLPADPKICLDYVKQEFNATSIKSITDRKTGRVIE
jgi:hypothetical protein